MVEVVRNLDIDTVFPSPENDRLYGAVDPRDPDLINLAIDIRDNGLREPIVISHDRFIVSGHRRYAACELVGLRSIPVRFVDERRTHYDETGWLKLLRAHNHQRVKSSSMRVKEALLDIDPELAHKQLIEERKKRDMRADPVMQITGTKTRSQFSNRLQEFLHASVRAVIELKQYWPVTVRWIHYRLLNDPPMINTSKGVQRRRYENNKDSYDKLTDLLVRARLFGYVPWEAITDETRPTMGTRFDRDVAQFVDRESYNFLRGYRRDLLQSQPDHVELIVEKMTAQTIVEPVADKYCLPMTIGRGYCSIEPRYEIVQRFKRSGKDRLKLVICSDFDPDGDEIAESFARSIRDDFGVSDVVPVKAMLRRDQVDKWSLPENQLEAKQTSKNYAKFFDRYKSDQVWELEAIPPGMMVESLTQSIENTIDLDLFNAELGKEREDAAELQSMKNWFADAFPGMPENENPPDQG